MDLVTEQRLARRALILETARQMIAEIGYEAVTVRDLAERCRVSVPTLYNQFGGKDQLLGAAIEEHFLGVLAGGELGEVPEGFERLQRTVDRCAEQLFTLSAYHRRLLAAFGSLEQTATVQQRIAEQLTEVFAGALEHMLGARQLEPWVNTRLLAEQLTTGCISAALVWSTGLMPDDRLKASMRYASALSLAGVARGRIRSVLKAQIENSQRQLLGEAGAPVENRTAPGSGRP
jgi:AcrR family transcriptional regulator